MPFKGQGAICLKDAVGDQPAPFEADIFFAGKPQGRLYGKIRIVIADQQQQQQQTT